MRLRVLRPLKASKAILRGGTSTSLKKNDRLIDRFRIEYIVCKVGKSIHVVPCGIKIWVKESAQRISIAARQKAVHVASRCRPPRDITG